MPEKLDRSELERLFKEHYLPLCRFCSQFLRNTGVAEEIVQDKFLLLWERRDSLKIESSYKSFLYKAVRNQAIDYLRSRAAKFSRMFNEDIPELPDTGDPLSDLEYQELEKEISSIVESLPERCAIIFSLRRFGDLTNEEIANELNISEKTVLNQLTIATKLIKDAVRKRNLLMSTIISSVVAACL